MSKSNSLETDFLNKVFKNTALPWDAITDIYISLHTADPGEAGSQTTNEATYTGYARYPVVRSATGWTVSGNQVQNALNVTFPVCTSGSQVLTHFGVGTQSSGAGVLLFKGALTSPLTVSPSTRPVFAINQLTITEE